MQIWSSEIKNLEVLYTSIKSKFPVLEKELERLVKADDENMVLLYSRRCLEVIINDLCECELKRSRKTEPLKGIIDKLNREEKVPSHIIVAMQHLNSVSTFGAHPKDFDPEQVRPVLINLTTIIKWYLKYKETKIGAKAEAEEIVTEPKGMDDSTAQAQKLKRRLILFLSGLALVVVIVVVALFLFNIIGGGKQIVRMEKSIAVLPFENWNSDEEYAHMGDAIANEINTQLSKINEFHVFSYTSTSQYKGSNKPSIPVIGKELGANFIIEGSVERQKEDVSIHVQIIRAENDEHLWAEEFKGKWENIFKIRANIAVRIADELKIVLTPEEIQQIEEETTNNPEAYNLYLKGRYFWNFRTEETLLKAMEFFNQALIQDSNYALAYIGLADSYSMLSWYAPVPNPEYFLKAEKAALKALEKDNSLAEAHTSIGYVYFNEWKFEAAEKEYLKAIELDSEYATAHHWYALLLKSKGHFEQAIDEILKARDLDPLSLVINRNVGVIYMNARQYDNAIDALNKVVEIDPEFSEVHYNLAKAYLYKGMYENALSVIQKTGNILLRGIFYAHMGDLDKANQLLDELVILTETEYISPFHLALLYFTLGFEEKGFMSLEKAYEDHDLSLTFIKNYPELDEFSSDPRFIDLLKKVGLEE